MPHILWKSQPLLIFRPTYEFYTFLKFTKQNDSVCITSHVVYFCIDNFHCKSIIFDQYGENVFIAIETYVNFGVYLWPHKRESEKYRWLGSSLVNYRLFQWTQTFNKIIYLHSKLWPIMKFKQSKYAKKTLKTFKHIVKWIASYSFSWN